jgi:hypothetical protein
MRYSRKSIHNVSIPNDLPEMFSHKLVSLIVCVFVCTITGTDPKSWSKVNEKNQSHVGFEIARHSVKQKSRKVVFYSFAPVQILDGSLPLDGFSSSLGQFVSSRHHPSYAQMVSFLDVFLLFL